jgi:hypothetical protein
MTPVNAVIHSCSRMVGKAMRRTPPLGVQRVWLDTPSRITGVFLMAGKCLSNQWCVLPSQHFLDQQCSVSKKGRTLRIGRLVKVLTAATAGVMGAFTLAPAALANTAHGCNYPRVCFYDDQADFDAHIVAAAYQDVTSDWQTLGSSARNARIVHNTRNDDIAYFYEYNPVKKKDEVICLDPNSTLYFISGTILKKIRISSESSC